MFWRALVCWGCYKAFWAVQWYVECSGVFWRVLACSEGVNEGVLRRSGLFYDMLSVLACYGGVLGRSGLFYSVLSVLACSGVFWHVLACSGVFWECSGGVLGCSMIC
jgi:hypothetical protein